MKAPRITGTLITPAQNCEQQTRFVLKPTTSCSWPKTTTRFAARVRGARGTSAHDRANGAAAGPLEADLGAAEDVAVRSAAEIAIPATAQSRSPLTSRPRSR